MVGTLQIQVAVQAALARANRSDSGSELETLRENPSYVNVEVKKLGLKMRQKNVVV